MTVITMPEPLRNIFADAPDATLRRIALVAEALAELNDSDDRLPSWDADEYEPTDADWQEYSAWSRSLDPGVPVDALTIEECDLLAHSVPDRAYREMIQDEVEERYGEVWS
jgi:hypothetical protein